MEKGNEGGDVDADCRQVPIVEIPAMKSVGKWYSELLQDPTIIAFWQSMVKVVSNEEAKRDLRKEAEETRKDSEEHA
jgi:hypothetical protein